MNTFKTELLASDLPGAMDVSLRQAVCWLSRLPLGDLDDPTTSTPKHRTKAAIGRSQKSGQFWLVVLEHLASNREDPIRQFPWGSLSFHAQRELRHTNSERWATRLLRVASQYSARERTTPAKLIESWTQILAFEVDRIWAVRHAMAQISRHLPELLANSPESGNQPAIVEDILARENGYRISLRTGALYELTATDQGNIRGYEFWSTSDHQEIRIEKIPSLAFSTARLVDVFIDRPNAERDQWIAEKQERRFWPISDALAYLKFRGDWQRIWELSANLELMGIKLVFEVEPKRAREDSEPDTFDASEAAGWLVRHFRTGNVTVFGVRKGDRHQSAIPVQEWSLLGLKRFWRGPECIKAVDPTGLTEIEIDHLTIDASQMPEMLERFKAQTMVGLSPASETPDGPMNAAAQKRATHALWRHLSALPIEQLRSFNKDSQKKWLADNGYEAGSRIFANIRRAALENLSDDRRAILNRAGPRGSIETVNRITT